MSQGSLTPEAFESAKQDARRRGFEVVETTPKTVLLDLDNSDALAIFEKNLPIVNKYFGLCEKRRWASKRGNTHVELQSMSPLSFHHRLFLQVMLGSDIERESLSWIGAENGLVDNSVLFKPKGETNG